MRPGKFLKELLGSTPRERARILWLIPLLVALCLLFVWQGQPRIERSLTLYSDAVEAGSASEKTASPTPVAAPPEAPTTLPKEKPAAEAFPFDPNTIDLEGLQRLGFSPRQAQAILNYRKAGAVFRKPRDFARCHTVSEQQYARLESYIRIGKEFQQPPAGQKDTARRRWTAETPLPDTQPARKWITEDLPAPLTTELNGADSAALVALRGIASLSAGRIIAYRTRLGGFARAEQLREVVGVTEENYQLILQQIFVDRSKIQKIDINFASPERMGTHPYLPPRTVDKILKNRQLKGGWSSTQELIEQHILSREQADRLEPYLSFSPEDNSQTEF